MYGVDTLADFAECLTDEDEHWPADTKRPTEGDVEVHPQGQVYVDTRELTGPAVTYLIERAEKNGFRVVTSARHRLAIFQERDRCAEEGCYARAQGGSKRGHLCAPHAREAKKKRMQQGLPPVRGEDY